MALEGAVDPDEMPELKDLGEDGLTRFPEPVQYKLNVNRVADIVEVDGILESVVELSCGRCLERYTMPFTSKFSVAYTRHLPECTDEDDEGVELTDILA